MQLVSAGRERAGSVLVCVNGIWGIVCGGELNQNFATVVCRQLGFSPYGTCIFKSYNNIFVTYYLPTISGAFAGRNLWRENTFRSYVMYHPQCTGNESNILSCPYNTSNMISSQCRSTYYDQTSVICLPGKHNG